MFANQFAPVDGKLTVEFQAIPESAGKSDSFIIRYGKELFIIDGGNADTVHARDRLLEIRAQLLSDHPELINDPSCKIQINCIITHFHKDHVAGLIESVCQNDLISIDRLYLPPQSRILELHPYVKESGDSIYRPKLKKALEEYHPMAKVYNIGYGKESLVKFTTGSGLKDEVEISILPPSADWCMGERFEFIKARYALEERPERILKYSMNSSSLWVHVRLGENSFLITGDTMKKFDDNNVEAVDEMLALYAEEYSPVTVLKYVHHGHARQTSADCMLALKPQNLIFTAYEPNCVGYMMKKYPDITERVNFYINNNQAIVFECTAAEKLTPPDCMIKN